MKDTLVSPDRRGEMPPGRERVYDRRRDREGERRKNMNEGRERKSSNPRHSGGVSCGGRTTKEFCIGCGNV